MRQNISVGTHNYGDVTLTLEFYNFVVVVENLNFVNNSYTGNRRYLAEILMIRRKNTIQSINPLNRECLSSDV